MVTASFQFHSVLNDFLAPRLRERHVEHDCSRDATVKHMIEVLGVPHTEVDLVLVNGISVDFSYRLQDGDRVHVYPPSMDMTVPSPLRPPLQERARFIADAHLGQLARQLRMLGFDVLYRNDYSDAEVARIAATEGRIVLTRDRDLLIRKEIVYGCYLHSVGTDAQLAEVVQRYHLSESARAFSRCLACNGELRAVDKQQIQHRVPPHSRQHYEHFRECPDCEQVYWDGSHMDRMRIRVARMLGGAHDDIEE